MESKSVLLVSTTSIPSGVRSYQRDLVIELRKRGHRANWMTADPGDEALRQEWMDSTGSPPLLYKELHFPFLNSRPLVNGEPHPEIVSGVRRAFVDALVRSDADLIHFSALHRSAEAIRKVAREMQEAGFPLAHTNHDMYTSIWPTVPFDVDMHVTPYVREGHRFQAGKDPSVPQLIVPPGSDTNFFTPDGPLHPEIAGTDWPRILLPFRPTPGKGAEVAVRAFRSLRDRVGAGEYWGTLVFCIPMPQARLTKRQTREAIEAIKLVAAEAGVLDRLQFVPLHYREMPSAYRASTFVWHPSETFLAYDNGQVREIHEAFGKSPNEARACGLVAVTSDSGGQTFATPPGHRQFVARTGDHEDLARVSEPLLDPSIRQTLGLSGREHVVNNFGLSKMVDETIGAYNLAIVHRYEMLHDVGAPLHANYMSL